jgi:hypothetical protein
MAMVLVSLVAMALPVASWRPIEWSTTDTLNMEYKGMKRLYHTVLPRKYVVVVVVWWCGGRSVVGVGVVVVVVVVMTVAQQLKSTRVKSCICVVAGGVHDRMAGNCAPFPTRSPCYCGCYQQPVAAAGLREKQMFQPL